MSLNPASSFRREKETEVQTLAMVFQNSLNVASKLQFQGFQLLTRGRSASFRVEVVSQGLLCFSLLLSEPEVSKSFFILQKNFCK